MSYSKKLRSLFPEISLHWEDLLLLESFQVKYLPDRVAKKEFATLLQEYPLVHRFLVSKYSPINSFIDNIMEENIPTDDPQKLEEQCQEALWEIADLIIYNKHPELFDSKAPIKWDIEEIIAIAPLEGKIVADVGAGSGRIAYLVAPLVQTIYAVEPLASFREFMKEKTVKTRVDNLFVLDGTLDSVPLPDNSLDVLITSNAIGWTLNQELKEIERVIKPGGYAIHLLQSKAENENPFHDILVSPPWNYTCLRDMDRVNDKMIYHKRK